MNLLENWLQENGGLLNHGRSLIHWLTTLLTCSPFLPQQQKCL
jgi:hypothetical protein